MKMQRKSTEWRRAEYARRPYYKTAERMFRAALIKQLQPVVDNISPTAWEDAVGLINEGDIQEAFRYVYGDVGSAFATREFGKFAEQQAEDMRHVFTEFMRDYADRETGYRVTAITGTSKDYARRIIQRVVSENSTVGTDKLGMLLERELKKKGARISTWRARVIARTEVATASNMGQQIGAEAIDAPMVKTWLSQVDDRTRDAHIEANGQTVGMRESFIVGGEQLYVPCDANGSAANTVNCRCAVTYAVLPTVKP